MFHLILLNSEVFEDTIKIHYFMTMEQCGGVGSHLTCNPNISGHV